MKTAGKGRGAVLFGKIALLLLLGLILAASLAVIIPAKVVTDRLLHVEPRKPGADPGREGLEWEEIRYRSMDRRLVTGWRVPCRRSRPLWLILVPPFRSGLSLWSDDEGLSLLRRLNEHRWSVLVISPDRFPDSRDILGAVRYLKILDPAAEIGVMGWGEGGSAALCAAARSEDILFCIADSPYADLKGFLSARLPVWSRLPRFPWTPASLTLFSLRSGIRYREASPYEAVRGMNKPVLILLSDGNPVIDNAEGFLLQEASQTAELRLLPLADHTRGYAEYPESWMLEVVTFLQEKGFF